MPNESYRSLKTFGNVTGTVPDPLQRIPVSLLRKLEYYAFRPDEPFQVSTAEIVAKLAEAEHRSPGDYAEFLKDLSDYQVAYPNMFLIEHTSGERIYTEYRPKGPAAQRINQLAKELAGKVLTSGCSLHSTIDPEALSSYMQEYAGAHLTGPFPSIVDVGDKKPLMILQDMSYSGLQLFRAFSGVYCDYTPALRLSKLDFLEFSARHEIAHKRTEDILVNRRTNEYLPGIEMQIDPQSISYRNLLESAADAYAVLKYIQRTGTAEFPRQVAVMRTLAAFSPSYQEFETPFSLNARRSGRQRVVSEYYTTPAIRQAIAQGGALYRAGQLQNLGERDLIALALRIAREFKFSESALLELSALATTINFNNLPETYQVEIPRFKHALSPYAVDTALRALLQAGSFTPKGGDSIEKLFGSAGGKSSIFHQDRIPLSDEVRQVAADYHEAIEYLEIHGARPRSDRYWRLLYEDLVSTIGLPINQTPNMTVAREINDQLGSFNKLSVVWHHSYSCVGLDQILEAGGDPDVAFHLHQIHARYTDQGEDPLIAVLNWFSDKKA